MPPIRQDKCCLRSQHAGILAVKSELGLAAGAAKDTMPNSTKVTLKQLRYFARVVERGSISSASHDLNIAQTALGLQVRALEESLGVTLLIRHPKGVRPTVKGQQVYDASCEILGAVNAMVATVSKKSKTQSRDIWLGLALNLVRAIGSRAVVLQPDCIPGNKLHISEGSRGDLLQDVLSGKLDWAIVHEAEDVEGCHSVPILRQSVMLICKPGSGLASGPVALREALTHDLVLDSGRWVISGVLAKAAQALKLKPKLKFEVDSVSTMRQLILNEGVCGLLNQTIVRNEIDQGTLEGHTIIEPPLDITAYFVTRSQDMPSAADLPVLEFIDTLVDEFCAENPVGEVRLARVASLLRPELAK